MILTRDEFARTKDALRQVDLPDFARFVRAPDDNPNVDYRRIAQQLGWFEAGTTKPTQLGQFMRDPMREYIFWLERDRRLPFDDPTKGLTAASFNGKSVLEIGSGSGMNLFSLAGKAADLTGLEPIGLYRQMSEIMAEREGIRSFQTLPGASEALPFEDASFDTVLCVTAHQYFDIRPALNQIARVLRPDGEAIIIGGIFGNFLRGSLPAALRSPGEAKGYVKTIINTLSYMSIGKRVLVKETPWSTAHPIYPSRRWMCNAIEAAGMKMHKPIHEFGGENCWRALKPA